MNALLFGLAILASFALTLLLIHGLDNLRDPR
jgi:hypothetical protein